MKKFYSIWILAGLCFAVVASPAARAEEAVACRDGSVPLNDLVCIDESGTRFVHVAADKTWWKQSGLTSHGKIQLDSISDPMVRREMALTDLSPVLDWDFDQPLQGDDSAPFPKAGEAAETVYHECPTGFSASRSLRRLCEDAGGTRVAFLGSDGSQGRYLNSNPQGDVYLEFAKSDSAVVRRWVQGNSLADLMGEIPSQGNPVTYYCPADKPKADEWTCAESKGAAGSIVRLASHGQAYLFVAEGETEILAEFAGNGAFYWIPKTKLARAADYAVPTVACPVVWYPYYPTPVCRSRHRR